MFNMSSSRPSKVCLAVTWHGGRMGATINALTWEVELASTVKRIALFFMTYWKDHLEGDSIMAD